MVENKLNPKIEAKIRKYYDLRNEAKGLQDEIEGYFLSQLSHDIYDGENIDMDNALTDIFEHTTNNIDDEIEDLKASLHEEKEFNE